MNLQLSLRKKWFEMTKSGEKKEDYREITPYWANRLFNKNNQGNGCIDFWKGYLGRVGIENKTHFRHYGFKDFYTNTMTLGYPNKINTERILKIEHKGIEIRTGNPDWGAEPGKIYFVIKHGEIIK